MQLKRHLFIALLVLAEFRSIAGTVAWYRMEIEGALPAPATTLHNSAGSGDGSSLSPQTLHHVAVTNGYPVNGLVALEFLGREQASLPDPGEGWQSAFTIELLVQPAAEAPEDQNPRALLSKRVSEDPAGEETFRLDYYPLQHHFWATWRVQGWTTAVQVYGHCPPTPNRWQHLALTFRGSPETGYAYDAFVNGYCNTTATGENDLIADLGHGPFTLGGAPDTPLPGFSGLVDEVRISQGVLTPAEFLVDFDINPEPKLSIAIQRDGTPKAAITFPTSPFNVYILQCNSYLGGHSDWSTLPVTTTGNGFPMTLLDQQAIVPGRVYRLRIDD